MVSLLSVKGVKMSVAVYPLRQHGTRFWGRDMGASVRAEIEEQLMRLAPGDVLEVDLSEVEVMDFSFSGEVVGKLLSRLPAEYPGRHLILSSVTSYVRENLDAALGGMELAALVLEDNDWGIIGKFGETDLETLIALDRLKAATVGELSKQLGISVTACNNRLRKLTDLGLIRRERVSGTPGGDQYQYSWPL